MWSAAATLLLSCGEEFKAGDDAGGGSSGSAGALATAGKGGGSAGSGGTNKGGSSNAGGSSTAGSSGSGSGGAAGHGASGGTASGTGGSAGSAATAGSAGAGGDGPVEPDIPKDGLELWLRADKGIEGDGGRVTTWRDSSSHGRDASQTASNYRPRLVEGALGGKPAVVFDGEDDFLKLEALSVDFSAGVSIFVAIQQAAVDTCQSYFEASNGPEIDDLHFGTYRNALLFEVSSPYVNDVNYPLLVDAPQVAVGLLDTASLVHLRSNGNGAGEGAAEIPLETIREQVFIGKTLYADCGILKGTIGEILLYSRQVNDEELLQIEGYLQDKWDCCRP